MKLGVYFFGLGLATLLALACLTAILVYFDPNQASPIIFILFYSTVFFTSAGLLTIIGFAIRRFSLGLRTPLSEGRLTYQLFVSFRQGLLLSIILVGSLLLQSQRLLAWWNLAGLVVLAGLAEWWAGRR